MKLIRLTRGPVAGKIALVNDRGQVVSLHQDEQEAKAAYDEQKKYTAATGMQPPGRNEGNAEDLPAGPVQGPAATQGALERSRQPMQTAIAPAEPQDAGEHHLQVQAPPHYRIHQHGGTFVVGRNGEAMARFDNEDQAIEHVNMLKYAQSRGMDLGSIIPKNAPPLPEMSKGQTGAAEEELGVTKRLTDPYYGTDPSTRNVGPYRPSE